MTRLPVVSGAKCIHALERLGYKITHTRGSHVRLTSPGRNPVAVPRHAELDRGTLSSILRTVKIGVDEFNKLLHE